MRELILQRIKDEFDDKTVYALCNMQITSLDQVNALSDEDLLDFYLYYFADF